MTAPPHILKARSRFVGTRVGRVEVTEKPEVTCLIVFELVVGLVQLWRS